MKAADVIRKTLRESREDADDFDSPSGDLPPPGSLPGLAAFVGTGLLLSPLRSFVLKRAAVQPQQGVATFANFVDLLVTPSMAVISAQVGLVAGTLYGSGVYLDRVVEMEQDKNNTEAVCQAMLSAVLAQGHNTTLQSTSTDEPPQLYASWDPRQQTIQRLYRAIGHCQDKQRRQVERFHFG
jgi:hypothetical protein